MAEGGDGYSMLAKHRLNYTNLGDSYEHMYHNSNVKEAKEYNPSLRIAVSNTLFHAVTSELN